MTDILVVGSINMDLVVRANHFPAPGETIQGSELATYPGGKGANQAVAAARQGIPTAILGCVGQDAHGDQLIQNLRQNHVDTALVRRDEAATGSAIIIVDSQGQNSIVVSPGANGKLGAEDVQAVSDTRPKMLILQLEIPLESILRASALAKAQDTQVLLNPAPARPLPDALLSETDYLLPNEGELSQLSGRSVHDLASAESAARVLLDRGAKTIIVTLGPSGSLIVTQEAASHIPAYEVQVVDTTAAGDAFIGGFAAARLRGLSLEEAAAYGNACGALAASKPGAQPSLPTREEVERFMANQPRTG
jgi:ribokinase